MFTYAKFKKSKSYSPIMRRKTEKNLKIKFS